jgi:hypothetical protein
MRRSGLRHEHVVQHAPANGLRGCNGKRSYPNHADAARVAKQARRNLDEPLEAYKCQHCHDWHIGQPPEKGARRRPQPDDGKATAKEIDT